MAICEQTEDPAATKGIVQREIVRVVSPGMAFDADSLESGRNNYLFVLHPSSEHGRGAYCVSDITTGSLEYAEYTSLEQLRDDLSLIQAREIAVPSAFHQTAEWAELVKHVGQEFFACVTPSPDFYFNSPQGAEELCRHFSVLNLEGFGLRADHPCLGAVGATFRTIRETQKQGDLRHLLPPTPRPREGQELKWVPPIDLSRYPMPPADVPLVGLLRDLL